MTGNYIEGSYREGDGVDKTPEASEQLLKRAQGKFTRVPNLLRAMAKAPAALKAYLDFSDAMDECSLPREMREQIALAVANANNCEYCLSAHAAVSRLLGIPREEIAENMRGFSYDPKTARVLKFAVHLVETNGNVSEASVEALHQLGFSEQEVGDIVAVVSFNLFANYFNHVTRPKMDYPAAEIGIHDVKVEHAY